MTELRYDEEATKRLLAVYLTPDVVFQREQFLRALNPQPGERVLDIGSGPGFLASSIAEETGSTGVVRGIDVSEPMIELSRDHCTHQPWREFSQADATKLDSGEQRRHDKGERCTPLRRCRKQNGNKLNDDYRLECEACRIG